MEMAVLAAGYAAVINFAVFVLYGIDKCRARHHQWRIPEKTLLTGALIGGAPGAFLAMKVFHHKTRHRVFSVGVPLMTLLWAAVYAWLIGRTL